MPYTTDYTKWQDIYFRYRTLKERWNCPVSFEDITDGNKDIDLYANKQLFINANNKKDEKENWRQFLEAVELRGYIKSMPEGWSPDNPLDDVYQAALRMETRTTWNGDQEDRRIYRGQRNHLWSVIPSMFRGDQFKKDDNSEIIKSEVDKIYSYVRVLQRNHPGLTDEEGVAIVQHYSSELKLGTWLIDFTFNPLIALFFASDGGKDGDIGKISNLSYGEWEKFSANGKNRLGNVFAIEPKGVPRIKAQEALFLDTSHPELCEQLNPFSLYFKQKTGLAFEDPSRRPAIEKKRIYPNMDSYKDELLQSNPVPNSKPFLYFPASDATSQLKPEDYYKIIESWYKSEDREITSSEQEIIMQISRIHAKRQMPEWKQNICITNRSLHRLKTEYLYVKTDRHRTLEQVYDNYLVQNASIVEKSTLAEFVYGNVKTAKLKDKCDYLARDKSEIFLLTELKNGGLCYCLLPVGEKSLATTHKTVEEIWFFLSGEGEVWRKNDIRETITLVKKDIAITIPLGCHFQFRNIGTEPLKFIIITMPPWPGAAEAELVDGYW